MAWLIKNKNDSLVHAGIGSHKYIDKYRDRKGNWQYIYKDDGLLTIGGKMKEAETARRERVPVNRQNMATSIRKAGNAVADTAKSVNSSIQQRAAEKRASEERGKENIRSVGRSIGNKLSPIANEYSDRLNTMSKVNARSRAEKESIDKAVNDHKTKERNEWWRDNVGERYQLGDNSLRDERDLAKLAPHSTTHGTDAGSQQASRDKMKQVRDSVKDSARKEATKTVDNLTKQLNAKKNATPFRGGDDRGYKLDQQKKAEEHARQVAEAEKRNKPTGIPANATRYNKEEHDALAREYNKSKRPAITRR